MHNNPLTNWDPTGHCISGESEDMCLEQKNADTVFVDINGALNPSAAGTRSITSATTTNYDPRHADALTEGVSYLVEGTGIPDLARMSGYSVPELGDAQHLNDDQVIILTIGGMFLDPAASGESTSIRVGRWMSQTEYKQMLKTGMVQESFTGTTHVALPASVEAFEKQAKPGSVYVEFNVPNGAVKATQEGWGKIIGPNSLEGRLAQNKGLPVPQLPPASNIQMIRSK